MYSTSLYLQASISHSNSKVCMTKWACAGKIYCCNKRSLWCTLNIWLVLLHTVQLRRWNLFVFGILVIYLQLFLSINTFHLVFVWHNLDTLLGVFLKLITAFRSLQAFLYSVSSLYHCIIYNVYYIIYIIVLYTTFSIHMSFAFGFCVYYYQFFFSDWFLCLLQVFF